MTMEIECEEPKEVCEEIEEGVIEELPETSMLKQYIKKWRSKLRRYRPSFIEFFLLNLLDLLFPKAKENIWWETYPQDKNVERMMQEVEKK